MILLLIGECIGGALIWTDLIAMACEVGFAVPILVDVSPIVIEKPELKDLTGIFVHPVLSELLCMPLV